MDFHTAYTQQQQNGHAKLPSIFYIHEYRLPSSMASLGVLTLKIRNEGNANICAIALN